MSYLPDQNYFYEVSLGRVAGRTAVKIVGNSTGLATGVLETVWTAPQTIYTPPATAAIVDIKSSSAADTAAGTGARTIRVKGIDNALARVTEDKTMNGTTNVPTTTLWFAINEVDVLTAGSGETNAGDITFITQGSALHLSHVPANFGRQSQMVYTAGTGETLGLLNTFFFLTEAKGSDVALLQTTVRNAGLVKFRGTAASLVSSGVTAGSFRSLLPTLLTVADVFTVEAVSDINNSEVGLQIEAIRET